MDHKPIAHHFAPRFYLKAFSCDPPERGHVWVYQKGNAPARRSVNRTAMEENLYAFTHDDGQLDNQSVESVLQKIDSDAACVIRKLHERSPLTQDERRHFSVFVSRMLRGTPAHRQRVNNSAAEMMPAFYAEHDETWLRGMIEETHGSGPVAQRVFDRYLPTLESLRVKDLSEVPDHLFPHEVIRPSVIESVIFEMDWALFESRPSVKYLTCDNPVVYSRGSGLADRERGLVVFPLSPDLCLQAMWCTTYADRYARPLAPEIRRINRYIVQNAVSEVYAHVNSPSLAGFMNKWAGTVIGTGKPN